MSFAITGTSPYAGSFPSSRKNAVQSPAIQFGVAFPLEMQANTNCVPTPAFLAQRMIKIAGITPGMHVLEPSAGTGNIARELQELPIQLDVCELDDDLRAILAEQYNVIGSDFLEVTGREGFYDRALVNPPFSRYARHIKKAYDMLKPGGRLVAIVPGRALKTNLKDKRKDIPIKEFQQWLKETGCTIAEEDVPITAFSGPDSGRKEGKGLWTKILILDKPDNETNASASTSPSRQVDFFA
jgi:phospholipid N-methyltransferase